jgi:hypothetical protein
MSPGNPEIDSNWMNALMVLAKKGFGRSVTNSPVSTNVQASNFAQKSKYAVQDCTDVGTRTVMNSNHAVKA